MAIAKMSRLYLVAHQAEKDEVLDVLQQMGVVEISVIQSADDTEDWAALVDRDQAHEEVHSLETVLVDVRFALDFLNRHYPAKKNLLDVLGGNRVLMTLEEFTAQQEEWSGRVRDVSVALRKVDERLMSLRNEETRLQNLKSQLIPWSKLDVPLEEVRATDSVHVELGTMPTADAPAFRTQLAAGVDGAFLSEVNADRKDTYFFLVYSAGEAEEAQAILKQFNFSRYQFPSLRGTPAENLANIQDGLAAVATERQGALADAEKHKEHRGVINFYSDYLTAERDKKQVVDSFVCTKHSFVVEGWVREADLGTLKKRLAERSETAEVFSRPPQENEAFPVLLENNRFVAPFEFITQLYGTPAPRSVDPTLPLAPFFVVFFGLCLSDAGYGVLLSALTGLALWKLRMAVMARKIMWVLFAGGLSTIFFGVLISGWFGEAIWGAPFFFNALDDPMRMLIYSLGIGLVQIFFGMGIKFYCNVRDGKILAAISDQLFWAMLIIGLLLLALPDMSGVGRNLALFSAAGLVLTQGRAQRSIVMKFLSGLFSLYNITGVLGDILSYSRLLALGLATSVIAMAINMLAGLLGGTSIGFIIMIILLVVGHIFNLVINILGSYVHSSRLQYLEFFNRFYEGGGRPFKPFRLNTRHIEVIGE
ncbi:MAG: V-type ATP synthase subunit I [Firmicutes bacterium]|nr:V-type ATP synthase subunit I [Bacillota bacterium]